MLSSSFGGLVIADGGATTLALTTTLAKCISWSGTKGAASAADSNTKRGDPAVVPDVTNNRIKVLPGDYQIDVDLSGTTDAVKDVVIQVYVNGKARGDLTARGSIASSQRGNLGFSGILSVTAADVPGTIATFADPSSSGFAGAGGAPKTESYVELYIGVISSSCTLTLEAAHMTLTRLN